MKTFSAVVMAACVCGAIGCEEKQPAPAPKAGAAGTTGGGAAGALESAKNQVSGATAALKEERDKVVADTQTKMDEIKAAVDQWKTKNSGLTGDAKAKFDSAVTSLESAGKTAQEKLTSLKGAAESSMKSAGDELSAAMTKLNQAYTDAKAKFGG